MTRLTKFGHFTLHYVDAVVMPNLSQPLLGMNVLKQFRVKQNNGQMRLSRNYQEIFNQVFGTKVNASA